MAGQTYEVNYIVNVTTPNAQTAVAGFKTIIEQFTAAAAPLQAIKGAFTTILSSIQTLQSLKAIQIKVSGTSAKVINEKAAALNNLTKAMTKAQKAGIVNVGVTAGSSNKTSSSSSSSSSKRTSSPKGTTTRTVPFAKPIGTQHQLNPFNMPKSAGYKALGATPLPGNGGMAIDMLKGMGIAYGIAGIGSAISNIVTQATEYDNLMKSVENILKTHDDKGNFSSRFASMSKTIRDVGMETKFKVTEVADAAKFLAMAGLNLEAIQQAIRPIADIALVGDTELGLTADLVTNVMTAYDIAPERMRLAADIMTNTFTMSNTTLTEIAEAYKYSASLLSKGGVSFEEATAAIGVLGDAGIKGSQAGTTMRTIMANLVNPTKKQRAAWKAIGISRTDESGNMKDPLEIFKELDAAGLGVADYYRLFHKTAASGAVALASHVDKWDKVMLENMVSGGLSAKLADEKKNTIQGLWAQLISVFTDDGVTAFGGIQSTIKGFMKSIVEWLKSDEAKNAFNGIAKSLVEFMKIIKEVTVYFGWFFKSFSPFIKFWMKFQLYIWPVVGTLKALFSVINGLTALRKVGMTMRYLGQSFMAFKASTVGLPAAGAAVSGAVNGAAAGAAASGSAVPPLMMSSRLPALTESEYAKVLNRHKLTPVTNEQGGITGIMAPPQGAGAAQMKAFNKQIKWAKLHIRSLQTIKGVAAPLGMAGTMWGLSQAMDEENGKAGKWAGGLFTAAGATLMMFPNIWGAAIAGGLAAIGGVLKVVEYFNKISEAQQKIRDMAQKFSVSQGQIFNDNMSELSRYLALVHQKNLDIDEVLQLRIKHQRELLGLESGPEGTDGNVDTSTFTESRKAILKGGVDEWLKQTSNQEILQSMGLTVTKDKKGNYRYTLGDWNYHATEPEMAFVLAMADYAAHGKDMQNILDEFGKEQTKYVLSNDVEGLRGAGEAVNAQYGPKTWGDRASSLSWLWGKDDYVQGLTDNPAKFKNHPLLQRLRWARLYKDYGPDNEAIAALERYNNSYANKDEDLLDSFIALSRYFGLDGLSLEGYNSDSPSLWENSLGFTGQTFVPRGQNKNGQEQAQTVANAARQTLTNILPRFGITNSDDEKAKKLVEDINRMYEMAMLYDGILKGGVPNVADLPDNFVIPYNGKNFIYDAKSKTFNEAQVSNDGWGESLLGGVSGHINHFLGNDWDDVSDSSYNWGKAYHYNIRSNFFSGFGPSLTLFSNNSVEQTDSISGLVNGVSGLFGNASPWISATAFNWGISNGFMAKQQYGLGFSSGFGRFNFGIGAEGGTEEGEGGGGYTPSSPFMNMLRSKYTLGSSPIPFGKGIFHITPGGLSYSGEEVMKDLKQRSPKKNDPFAIDTNDTDSNSGTGHLGTDASDYKSHQRERAVPKQININIQNLMKVDKVDMSNPHKAEVINKLKQEVAYALVEAAGDGVEMLNGLTKS